MPTEAEQLAALAKFLKTPEGQKWLVKNSGQQSLGEPAGNPGYSIPGTVYAKQHLDAATGKSTWTDPRTGQVIPNYVPGTPLQSEGAVWVGAEGGDTPENKALFEGYLKANADLRDEGFSIMGANTGTTDTNTANRNPPRVTTTSAPFVGSSNGGNVTSRPATAEEKLALSGASHNYVPGSTFNPAFIKDAPYTEEQRAAYQAAQEAKRRERNPDMYAQLDASQARRAHSEAIQRWMANPVGPHPDQLAAMQQRGWTQDASGKMVPPAGFTPPAPLPESTAFGTAQTAYKTYMDNLTSGKGYDGGEDRQRLFQEMQAAREAEFAAKKLRASGAGQSTGSGANLNNVLNTINGAIPGASPIQGGTAQVNLPTYNRNLVQKGLIG